MKARLSLNPSTIRQCKRLDEKIKVAYLAGYDGIELRYNEVEEYKELGFQIKDISDLLCKYGLKVTCMGYLGGWQNWNGIPLICSHDRENVKIDANRLLEKAHEFFLDARQLGCDYASALPSLGDIRSYSDAIREFQALCDIGNDYEMNLAFEFVGFSKYMNTLRVAWDIVKGVERDNAGILLDTFQLYRGDSNLRDLQGIPIETIFLVHISDVPNIPRSELEDKHRVYPGRGVIPLKEIVRSLDEKGYGGYFSLELFNEEYWKADPLEVAIEGRRCINKLL